MTALLLLLGVATAQTSTTKQVEVCLRFVTDFDDVDLGDFWTDDTVAKRARGLHVRLTDLDGAHDHVLDGDGCVTTDLRVPTPSQTFLVKAVSKATLNGVDLIATENNAWPNGDWVLIDDTPPAVPLTEVQWSVSASTGYVQRDLPIARVWNALAVGTWVFHRNDFHVTSGSSRDCCDSTDPGFLADGTCDGANPELLDPVGGAIYFFAGLYPNGDEYCGNSSVAAQGTVWIGPNGEVELTSSPDPEPADWEQYVQHETRPAVHVSCRLKRVIAHELGHVIASTRTGGREARIKTAPIDGCVANYRVRPPPPPQTTASTGATAHTGSPYLPNDTGGAAGRGNFSKEYMAEAFKEGWADFVAIWAWNRRTDSDCDYENVSAFYDFDIDRSMDTGAYGSNRIDCIGFPDPSSNPTGGDKDWLEYAIAQGFGPGWTLNDVCRTASSGNEGNRSTVYDVAKMYWHYVERASNPYGPDDMADIHVGTCPATWATSDRCRGRTDTGDPAPYQSFPYYRLLSSMTAHSMPFGDQSEAADYILHGSMTCD